MPDFCQWSFAQTDTPLPAGASPVVLCLPLLHKAVCLLQHADELCQQLLLKMLWFSDQYPTACRDVAWLCLVKASGAFCWGAADVLQVSSTPVQSLQQQAQILEQHSMDVIYACCMVDLASTQQQSFLSTMSGV